MNNAPQQPELISAYLDGDTLDASESALVKDMLANDPVMKREAELIQAVRMNLRAKRTQLSMQIPVDVERAIRLQLGEEVVRASEGEQRPTVYQRLLALLSRPLYAVPSALLLAVITTGVVMMVNRSGQSATSGSQAAFVPFEITSAAYANFQSVVNGKLELSLTTSDTSDLKRFFKKSGVSFDVFFPQIAADLKGGIVSTHGDKQYAHLVYGAGSHTVYLLEVDEPSIESGQATIADNVAQGVEKDRWHWEERDEIGTLFVWKSNTIMCSAVSDLRTQDFSALFSLETL